MQENQDTTTTDDLDSPATETTAASDLEDTVAEDTAEEPAGEEAPLERRHIELAGVKPEVAALGINTFDDLPLHARIREAVAKIGWQEPTPVQKLCLPYTLRGRHVAGFAQTGTGKTAVFLLTIVNRLLTNPAPAGEGRSPRAIVIAPTRELAMQIEQDAEVMFQEAGLSAIAVFGGIDYDKQAKRLKEGVDVIFATPGRLKDYVQKKWVRLDQVEVFVCDEADRMFDMGFIEDVEFFLERIPENAQRLLFSATTNEQVKELAFEYLETPEYISVNPEVITPERIEQHGIHCHATQKLRVMLGLMREHNPECSLIFTNTKLTAEWLHFKLTHNGIEADLITGDLPQSKRIRLIHRIKEGKLKALIATDVASRGLHISRVTHVYNFDLPDEAANYVHRIGRTARAGARGFAYSLVCDDYGQNLAAINDMLGDAAVQTEWPKEEYMSIEDAAGNPFQERYDRVSRERQERASYGARNDRSGSGSGRRDRPDRPDRADRGGPTSRGPRNDRSGRGGPDEHLERQGAHAEGQMPAAGNDAPRKKRRRRRGKGRGGEGGASQGEGMSGQGQQQQGRQNSGRPGDGRGGSGRPGAEGRRDQQRGPRQGRPQESQHGRRGQQPLSASASKIGTPETKSFGGMIKKLVKTIFGIGGK